MRVISWFSGIGGFDLGLLEAARDAGVETNGRADGFEIVGACERDPFALAVYQTRFQNCDVPWFPEDIEEVKAHDIPKADLWVAGSPCQDFSIAGPRTGLEGERSGLLRTWLALCAEVRPRWLLLENVPKPGILDASSGRDFGELLTRLDDVGYRWAWRVLDAQFFGVPQSRKRVFLVACLGDGNPAEVLFERSGGAGDIDPSLPSRPRAARRAARSTRDRRVAGTLQASDGGPDDIDAANGRLVAGTMVGTLSKLAVETVAAGYVVNADTSTAKEEAARESEVARSIDSTGGFAAGQGGTLVASSLRAADGHHGRSSPRGDGSDNLVLAYAKKHAANDEFDAETWQEETITPTLTPNDLDAGEGRTKVLAFSVYPEGGQGADLVARETDLAPALSTEEAKSYERGTRVASTRGVRRLTPTECERLQGFPDGWTCLCHDAPPGERRYRVWFIRADYSTTVCRCKDGPRYHTLGNAVAVPVIAWIGRRLLQEVNGLDRR